MDPATGVITIQARLSPRVLYFDRSVRHVSARFANHCRGYKRAATDRHHPSDNAVAVAVGSNITMTFNENIMAGSGNLIIRNGAGTDVRTIDINDSTQISISGNTMTINPTNLLLKNTGYYIQLASGVIKDTAGNNYAGIGDTTTFNFTTINASPPIITNVPENSGGGINAAEAADGTFVVVNLDKVNTRAVAGNTLTIDWGGQTVNYTLLAADIAANSATVFIPYATINTQGNGYLQCHRGNRRWSQFRSLFRYRGHDRTFRYANRHAFVHQ